MSKPSSKKTARKNARARKAKTANKRKTQKGYIMVRQNLLELMQKFQTTLPGMTGWNDYAVTETGSACIKAWVKRQLEQGTPEASEQLIDGLWSYRDQMDKASCAKFSTDSDGLRDSASTPQHIRFHFGILDMLIGAFMTATAEKIVINVGDGVEVEVLKFVRDPKHPERFPSFGNLA